MIKIEELLAVRDLPEMEQAVALYNAGVDVINNRRREYWNWGRDSNNEIILKSLNDYHGIRYINVEQLAFYAFQRRDEVVKKYGLSSWSLAMMRVCHNQKIGYKAFLMWCHAQAQPIHWIIAVLIVEVEAEKE